MGKPITPFIFTPVVKFEMNSCDESDIVFEDCFENFISHLDNDTLVLSVVMNDLTVSTKNQIESLIIELKDGCLLSNLTKKGFKLKNPFSAKILNSCDLIDLSDITLESVKNTPLLMLSDILCYESYKTTLNVLFFVLISDNLRTGLYSENFLKNRGNIVDTNNLRYEQFCILTSFVHVLSSFQLFQIPLFIENEEINPEIHSLFFDDYLSYVTVFRGYSFTQCRVGLCFEHDRNCELKF